MYKNQLQELAQRSCFNLPAYACIREGPDHAPRFKATVNFNGEVFESPNYWGTLRQAEHAAAEVALNTLSRRGPSQSLAARILDETGVCKNLLQETAQRAGVSLPVYSTIRSGPGHLPVFTCVVEVAGLTFSGEAAKTKKQAEKNAAMAAWLALKQSNQGRPTTVPAETEVTEEQEQNTIARTLATAFYKEASVPSVQSMPQQSQAPIGSSIPTRIRVVPRRDQGQGSGGVPPIGQYHHRSWLPDITIDQRLHHNQLHPSMVTRTAHRRVGPPCPGLTAALQDAPDMSREALRVVASSLGSGLTGVAPVHVRSLVPPRRDRHEMKLSFDEHQRDEDDWLRGDSLKSNSETDNRSDTSDIDRGSPVMHGSYNPMLWSGLGSSQLWGQYPTRAAMPVRVRPAVTVCAAPPPRCPVEQVDPESEGEAAAHKVMSQLRL
ncbi:hypothetical protein BDL97_06G129700 [Sphagnum fallax]|nr:hypothetical protein BDL97_06G129700 [Sphagnum fallax]